MKDPQDSNLLKSCNQDLIEQSLDELLAVSPINHVYFADSSIAPPHAGEMKEIDCKIGEAVFVARNCWDKPKWAAPVKVLTLLFGKKQIGFSLVTHDGSTEVPIGAVKASIPSTNDDLSQSILNSLISLNEPNVKYPIGPFLVAALLHSCLHTLQNPNAMQLRKANHTYDAICLFVQEHYQQSLSRDSVAEHFGLHPCHISRLFRDEGNMRFTDYVNLVRIERAKFLLKNYDMPLKEISTSCGFSDVAYFCRVFRMMTKVTPSIYRLRGL
jgi:AraC-like DNA-binding protein